jgi:hypothetical protein
MMTVERAIVRGGDEKNLEMRQLTRPPGFAACRAEISKSTNSSTMNSRTTAGDKKMAFVLKEFQPAKPKSGYDIATENPMASLIYEASSSFDAGGTAADMNGPAGLTGLIHHDDYKRLKADVEHNRTDRTASPTPDPAYALPRPIHTDNSQRTRSPTKEIGKAA